MDIDVLGQKFWIYGIKGTVKGIQKWSSTDVSVSGGPNPSVSSRVSDNQEFWIVSPSGREQKVKGNYDVRDGQTVWLVWGGNKGKDGNNIIFHNCTTGSHWNINRSFPNSIAYKGQKELTIRFIIYILFIPLVVSMILYTLSTHNTDVPLLYTYFDTFIFFIIPLMVIGFIKLKKIAIRVQNESFKSVNDAINNNPDFIKSLEQ